MKILSIVLTAMLLTLTSQVFAGEQDSMGKIKLTFVIVAPGNLSDEGKQLFLSHAAWMKATHHRTGPKALLSYDVSEMNELSDPGDLNSEPTGNKIFILSEIYESHAGVEDHYALTPDWKDWSKFSAWMKKCKVTRAPSAKIFNSLTWNGK
jgi:hypothetical protein